jgi:hypothetical protein
MDSDDGEWEESSEAGSQPSTSTSDGTVRERMYQLESDEESGWYNLDRHNFSLLRVPETFLEALKFQVQTPHGSIYGIFHIFPSCHAHYALPLTSRLG